MIPYVGKALSFIIFSRFRNNNAKSQVTPTNVTNNENERKSMTTCELNEHACNHEITYFAIKFYLLATKNMYTCKMSTSICNKNCS